MCCGLLIWRCQVWEPSRGSSSSSSCYLAFLGLPASIKKTLSHFSCQEKVKIWVHRRKYPALEICIVRSALLEPVMSNLDSCDLLLFKSALNWRGLIYLGALNHPELSTRCIHRVNYSRISMQLIYEPPHRLLMYCWYMLLRQLCVIYAGITIDARTGHTLVGLH